MSSRSHVLTFLMLVSVLTTVLAMEAGATVLTFDVRYLASINASTDTAYGGYRATTTTGIYNVSGYGDGVFDANPLATTHMDTVFVTPNGGGAPQGYEFRYEKGGAWTPNITVSYDVEADAGETVGSGIAANNDFGSAGASIPYLVPSNDRFWYTLTPTPGNPVQLHSFDLLTYLGATQNVTWSLYAGTVNGIRTGVTGTLLASQTLTGFGATITNPARVQYPNAGLHYGPLTLEVSGSDPGSLAVDNISFTPEPAALTLAVVGGLTLLRRRRR